ncbi:unnamed protein product [Acanthoscelides obtectus]|uniref:Uncharacterized protein n=1 Tax=Acanthoscelides obtectus TaxID=200917 RepID=A0A9P0PQ85_ACAOB|nr:unnamed protein product [Acanthoscelides obtectus]CAK1655269.1 hypothetical protein AOBTE_LOCUS19117 [Acanthoscelides obtectus]
MLRPLISDVDLKTRYSRSPKIPSHLTLEVAQLSRLKLRRSFGPTCLHQIPVGKCSVELRERLPKTISGCFYGL